MKRFLFLLIALCACWAAAQQPAKIQPAQGAPAGASPQTETIPAPQSPQASQPVNAPGYMDRAQVEILVHKIGAMDLRIEDLLKAVHLEKWIVSNIIRNSLTQTLENLRTAMDALEAWRSEFEKRPDSIYYGFQTYAAINAALPRLDGVAHAVSQYENPSLGAQYSQAGDQLFDLQQTLQPYIAYLLRSPDQVLFVSQNNLAACQKQLGTALNGQSGPATPLKNTFVEFHARRGRSGKAGDRKSDRESKGASNKSGKKAETPAQPQPAPSH
jgi:hypothetical protein